MASGRGENGRDRSTGAYIDDVTQCEHYYLNHPLPEYHQSINQHGWGRHLRILPDQVSILNCSINSINICTTGNLLSLRQNPVWFSFVPNFRLTPPFYPG